MAKRRRLTSTLKGFTLIELLVVIAIIALLISILLPSLGRARKQAEAAACGAGLQQIMLALRMYQDEHHGSLPCTYAPGGYDGSAWSEAAWSCPNRELWFYAIVPKYLSNPQALICPGDPFRRTFDFEKRDDPTVAACGYGMNYVLRHFPTTGSRSHSYLFNTDRYAPLWPARTILLADVGPDDGTPPLCQLEGSADAFLARPWRDGGRLVWNDGVRAWYTSSTWLTTRHIGAINMSTLDGHVQRVSTIKHVKWAPTRTNAACWGLILPSRKYVCFLCNENTYDSYHYQFHEQQLWWWTGAIPPE